MKSIEMNIQVIFGIDHKSLSFINKSNDLLLFSSVEHQIADIKQRLSHIEHLAIEHETEYKNFEENLQGFGINVDTFKQTLQINLMEITMDGMTGIDVSFHL